MFQGRKKDLQWLSKMSRLNRGLWVSGVSGVGKTALLRQWLSLQNVYEQKHIYTFDGLRDFSVILDVEAVQPDRALLEASKKWPKKVVIVWDQFENLSRQLQDYVLNIMHNESEERLHVIVSSESSASDLALGIPQWNVKPFDSDELVMYIQNVHGQHVGVEQCAKIIEDTAGLPILLNLWPDVVARQARFTEKMTKGLSKERLSILSLLMVLGRELADASLLAKSFQLSPAELKEALNDLMHRQFIEVEWGEKNKVTPQSGLRQLFLKTMSAGDRKHFENMALELLEGLKQAGPLEKLFHLLSSGKKEALNETISSLLKQQTLNQFSFDKLQNYLNQMNEYSIDGHSWRRLKSNVLNLLGRRKEAQVVLEFYVDALLKNRPLSVEAKEYLFDYIQILNRNLEAKKVVQLVDQLKKDFDHEWEIPLALEEAIAYRSSDALKSRQILDRLNQKQEDTMVSVQIRANIFFQMARWFDTQGEGEQADPWYAKAQKCYEEEQNHYLLAVTLLNRAWIAAYHSSWLMFREMKAKLIELERTHSFRYISAGLRILEAMELRLSLDLGRALQKVDEAQRLLGTQAPGVSLFDVQAEKIRILIAMGLRSLARPYLRDLEQLVLLKDLRARRQELDLLNLEMNGELLAAEDLYEKCGLKRRSLKEFPLSLLLSLLHRDLMKISDLDLLDQSILGRVCRLEYQIRNAVVQGEIGDVWPLIQFMEQELKSISDVNEFSLATKLLECDLHKNENNDTSGVQSRLEQIELDLRRWPAEHEQKAPFEIWLQHLKSNIGQSSDPRKDFRWLKLSQGQKDRWQSWIPQRKTKVLTYRIYLHDGMQQNMHDTDVLPEYKKRPGLVVVEHLYECRWKAKSLVAFQGRKNLLRLLALLLENQHSVLGKDQLVGIVWGESYNPIVHDSRVYTSIQRIRELLGTQDVIVAVEGSGYQWNQKYPFMLIKKQELDLVQENRIPSLVLETFLNLSQKGRVWISRGQLVKITQFSEASVKRALSLLVEEKKITRRGSGRAVEYSLK